MRIDTHLHFWQYQPTAYDWITPDMTVLRRDCLPAHLRPAMTAKAIDAGIAIQARADMAENAWLLHLANETPWILGVIGWVDFLADDCADHMAYWLAQPRMQGLRPMLQEQADPAAIVALPQFQRHVRLLQAQGGVFELLLRREQIGMATAFCQRHDQGQIILDHLGKPLIDGDIHAPAFTFWTQQMTALARLPHVSVKLSGLITEMPANTDMASAAARLQPYLDTVLQAFGPHRLLFGSDWPVSRLRGEYHEVVDLIHDWAVQTLSPVEQQALWGGNALRIYGLQP